MSLVIYNSQTQRKEEFLPRQPPRVGMYVCGVTVYDLCHLGHARANIVFDMVYRALVFKGYEVTYVRNFTDVDDKIIKRAVAMGEDPLTLASRYVDEFHRDMTSLGLAAPTCEPKATEHIPQMLALIVRLIAQGLAYESGGDVFYRVRSRPDYGKLSHKNIEELLAGARVEILPTKEDPLDFALWKAAKPGEPSWPSPWGPGRPGWHIECSAMGMHYLGATLDIHGGGRDLIFPHHENEIAQSEGATGQPFVRCWMHNGFVNIDAQKMSKSLGNFLTLRDLLKCYDSEVIRFFILASHYRSPLDYTEKNIHDAEVAVERVQTTLRRFAETAPGSDSLPEFMGMIGTWRARALEAMDDDFNSALALGAFFEAVRELNRLLDQRLSPSPEDRKAFADFLDFYRRVLGLFGDPQTYFAAKKGRFLAQNNLPEEMIVKKIADRQAARLAKDFHTADRIRHELKEMGIVLEDKSGGTEWLLG